MSFVKYYLNPWTSVGCDPWTSAGFATSAVVAILELQQAVGGRQSSDFGGWQSSNSSGC